MQWQSVAKLCETVVNPRTNLKVLEMLISVDPTGPTVPSYDDTDVVNPGLPWAAWNVGTDVSVSIFHQQLPGPWSTNVLSQF